MGYMGLSHWVESDNAADFRFVLQGVFEKHKKPTTLKKAVRALVMEELKESDNCYNTDGVVNVALVMEDEGSRPNAAYDDPGTPVFSKLLSKKEFQSILRGLDKLIKECDDNIMLGYDGQNLAWHRENYNRMRKCVFRKTYKE